jgi:hypothetical protein
MTETLPIGIGFSLESDDIQRLITALDKLRDRPIANSFRQIYQYHRQKTAERYRIAARATPFAEGSKGRRKPKSGRLIPDGAFGIDSGALFSDLVNNIEIFAGEIYYYTDLDYAGYMLALFAEKGPFAPENILFFDKEDIDKIVEIVTTNEQAALDAL